MATKVPGAVELLVCTRCRLAGQDVADDDRPGAVFYRRLAETAIDSVTITPVECLSNCSQGCTIALRGPGRWTYVYGRLNAETHVDTVREGAAKYAGTPDGLVPWRTRPEHFRKNCIARIPPLEDI